MGRRVVGWADEYLIRMSLRGLQLTLAGLSSVELVSWGQVWQKVLIRAQLSIMGAPVSAVWQGPYIE